MRGQVCFPYTFTPPPFSAVSASPSHHSSVLLGAVTLIVSRGVEKHTVGWYAEVDRKKLRGAPYTLDTTSPRDASQGIPAFRSRKD